MSPYILPYRVGKSYLVTQSYCDPTGSHQNQLAYDFRIPIGADIIAARAGTVYRVKDDAPDIGTLKYVGQHNFIFIVHDDGTVAFYAHLKRNSVVVEVGEYVQAGQLIATSGNSGSTGESPHLHFGVYESYYPQTEFDVPVNFRNAAGELDDRGGLMVRRYYEAIPYDP